MRSPNRLPRHAIALLCLVCTVAGVQACGGSGGGGSSPTQPESEFFLVAAGGIGNQSAFCCLAGVEVRLNGTALETYIFPQGGGSLIWDINIDNEGEVHLVPISPGRHDLTLVVTEDSSAPARYAAGGGIQVQDQAGRSVLEMDLADRTGRLAEGEGFSWSFQF